MDFVALIDLVKTVTRNKVKNIEVLGNPGGGVNLVESLYDAIGKGTVATDDEAAKLLYGKEEGPKSTNYLRTRNRLVRQLINTSLFIDINQPMFNDRAKAYYNCYRDFASAFILMLRDAQLAATSLFEQTLIVATKYEFVNLCADIALQLRREYSRHTVDPIKHEKMALLHREFEEKRRLEMLAFDYHETLIDYYLVRRSPNEDVHKLAATYFDELRPMSEKADTSQFFLYMFNVGLIKYFSINDCTGALAICDECLAEIGSRKNTNRASLVVVSLQKIACLIQLRRFNGECDQTVQYCLSLVEEGHLNWFRTHELQLHYCLFAQRYEDALEIFSKASQQEKFASLTGTMRDNWQLYGGYLHLLAVLGKLELEKVEAVVGPFRYGRLNNEINIVGKDKQGMNIPLILLPVIYAFAHKDFDNKNISPEGLDQYRKRYLNTDMNRRSGAFLNLLLAFSKKEYALASAERKIKKELEVLASEQPQVTGQNFAVEIIPYEDLWEMMTVDGLRRTADGGRRTADGRRRTVDGGRRTVDGGRRTAYGGR